MDGPVLGVALLEARAARGVVEGAQLVLSGSNAGLEGTGDMHVLLGRREVGSDRRCELHDAGGSEEDELERDHGDGEDEAGSSGGAVGEVSCCTRPASNWERRGGWEGQSLLWRQVDPPGEERGVGCWGGGGGGGGCGCGVGRSL